MTDDAAARTETIAVLGTGKVGGTLGTRWAQYGHTVVFGSRDPQSDRVRELIDRAGPNASASSAAEAAAHAPIVLMASPWPNAEEVLKSLPNLAGRILIDCTNPIRADFQGLDLGHTESAAERIAGWAPGARVVKAFNTASVRTMQNPIFGERRATMFYCGDDAPAKETVARLIGQLDFEPVDAGPLTMARYLEPFAWLYIFLAVKQGLGSNCAFQILRR